MVCLVASNFKDKTDNERLYLKGDVYSVMMTNVQRFKRKRLFSCC